MKRRALAGAALLCGAILVSSGCARFRIGPTHAPAGEPAPAPTEAPVPSPPTEPTPPEVAPAEPATAPVPPLAAPRPLQAPARVRIGLATDLESIILPCCDGELSVELVGARLDVVSPLIVRPAAASLGGLTYRVQVAALREEVQAREMATRIERLSGRAAEVRFDALGGLYRVRVGRHASREEAEEAGRELLRFGVVTFWVVTEGATLAEPALEITHRGAVHRVPGRRFVVAAGAGEGVRWEGRRYRGRLAVHLNDRGRLNLINELPIEDYLRGVVPKELGPDAYPEIEALKAQAIAARSYTLRNLGEFSDEGYDLCGTPRCQVYGGMDAEHPLSDRAVAETAGQVIVRDGVAIDALYSATCGGHTENVEVIFPLKRAAYLRGVVCIEAGPKGLGGGVSTASFPEAILARAIPGVPSVIGGGGGAAARFEAATLERALEALAMSSGLEIPEDRLESLDRVEVHRFLGSVFDLAADSRLFVLSEELDYLVSEPPPSWSESDRRFAAFMVKSGLARSDASTPVTAAEAGQLLFQLAIFLHRIEHREMTFEDLANGELVARDGDAEAHFRLPPSLATFRELGGETRSTALELVAGDELDLYEVEGELVAVVQHVDPRGASFDRSHKRSSWTRFKSDEELRKAVASRLPGFVFKSFEILTRGVSGRVGKIRLYSETGEELEIEGLPVRWTLDVPDTFFTARRVTPKSGPSGWQFAGRGWGHGVGLCQTGAFGMARRGHDADSIVRHYYSGTAIQTVEYVAD